MNAIVPVTPTSGAAYDVHIGAGLLPHAGQLLHTLGLKGKAAILADETVAPHYAETVLDSLGAAGFDVHLTTVPPGEKSKALSELRPVLSFLAKQCFERSDTLIALGGGVVGDLTGFAASAFLRGINFVQIPTTLLAMVDSSVGGKTGINLPEGKNLVGAFYQPRIVLADLDTLKTLPPRELSAGMAEAIKTGLIADADLFKQLCHGIPDDLAPIIKQCVAIKASVVAEDERETSGRRAILNFGHTIGHGIENALDYGDILHGEAVAIGMAAAARLSRRYAEANSGEFGEAEEAAIREAITASRLPLTTTTCDPDKIRVAMARDKKVAAGRIRWVLLPRIGDALVTADVAPELVDEALALACDSAA